MYVVLSGYLIESNELQEKPGHCSYTLLYARTYAQARTSSPTITKLKKS